MKYITNFNKYKKINEYLNFNDLKFKTILKNSTTEYFLKYSDFAKENNIILSETDNYSISNSNFSIEWELVIDARNYGVKDISIVIHKITGEFTLGLWQEDHDDEEMTFNFDSNEMGYKIEVKFEPEKIKDQPSYILAPNEIEIDFRSKIISIL